MPSRLAVKEYERLFEFVAARDGRYCLNPSCRKGPEAKLQLDHADNNPLNWRPENIHILCQRCNLAMRRYTIQEHVSILQSYSALRARERAREKGLSNTPDIKNLVDYRSGSPEMKANSYYERLVFEFILKKVGELGQYDKKDAINSSSLYSGCNPITATRYLAKLTSSIGPLREEMGPTGDIILVFREQAPLKPVTGIKHGGNGRRSAGQATSADTMPITSKSKACRHAEKKT